MGIDLLAGRAFNWSDDERALHVAIVSRTLARRLKPNGEVIGQHLRVQAIPGLDEVTIVGVVSDARLYDLRNSNLEAMYVPFLQVAAYAGWPTVLVQAQGSPAAMMKAIGAAIESLGREYPLSAMTLPQAKDRALLQERIVAMIGAFFGGFALLLAAIGLYGLMSYNVTHRTREVGIRMALGATRSSVVRAVIWEALTLMLIGITIGVPFALAASRLTTHLLFGLSSDDPTTLLVVALTLLLTGVLAGYLPARRAARIDPMVALRHD
jgi:ABC-type antimicrobial peptide transport system permease subunit